MSKPTCSSNLPGVRPAPRSAFVVVFLAVQLLFGSVVAGQDWVNFTDQTATRLVADPAVGSDDREEKDYAVGDVDRDGWDDVIVVRKRPFTVAGPRRNVLLMNENGVLTDRTAQFAPDFLDETDDRNVALADVDGDGWLDIITSGTFGEQPRILMNLGELGGVWQGFRYEPGRLPILTSPTGQGPKFCGLGVGDVTGNGRPDLYFTDYANDMEDRLLINDGTGYFTDQTATRLTSAMVLSAFGVDAHIVDVNGNGSNDIIKVNATGSVGGSGSPRVSVLYNDGTGHFTTWDHPYTSAGYMVATADFTQDGRLDLFVVDDGQDRYLVNTGNNGVGHAQFTSHQVTFSPRTTGFGGNVQFADLDNDGILDVVVADADTDIPGCDRRLALLQGQGTPPSIHYTDPLWNASPLRPWMRQGTFDVAVLDIDRDGVLDLVVGYCNPPTGSYSGGTKIFMGVNPNLLVAPGSVAFGPRLVGTVSEPVAVTLSNPGIVAIEVTAVTAPAEPFAAVGGSCAAAPFSLEPGLECTIEYAFAPTAGGSFEAALEITSSAPGSPDGISLEGVGLTLDIFTDGFESGDTSAWGAP
jgi:hypothetical protein